MEKETEEIQCAHDQDIEVAAIVDSRKFNLRSVRLVQRLVIDRDVDIIASIMLAKRLKCLCSKCAIPRNIRNRPEI